MENFTTIMEQYLVMHGVETMKTLNAIKDDCEANGKSMDFKFKIDFLKRVHYKYVFLSVLLISDHSFRKLGFFS